MPTGHIGHGPGNGVIQPVAQPLSGVITADSYLPGAVAGREEIGALQMGIEGVARHLELQLVQGALPRLLRCQ